MKVWKVLKWFIKSVLLGLIIVFVFNVIGVYFNLNIPLNIWTILLVGMLRLPGLAVVLILSLL